MSRCLFTVALAAGLLVTSAAGHAKAESIPGYITAAVADPDRPAKTKITDALRKTAETLAFIGLKPGDKVVDVVPGIYWDRLFSDVVGPTGHVYEFVPLEYSTSMHWKLPATSTVLPGHPNLTWSAASIGAFSTPEPVDVVWIRHNYHDLYDPFMGPVDVPAFNMAVYKALKPGGLYVIIDHSAKDGSGLTATNTLHRIDAAVVKKDMAAAGFVFAAESGLLRNPADPREALSYDPVILGKTDQFIYVFRKP